ncbi:MAG TPA: helix-turn-helix transcriptional regulator [Solirubrobacteraceae bacterium]|jgi:transcriptional regulator with XRE-family HTH domain
MTRSSTLDPALAVILRRMREERGITREALAFRSGVTVSGLARIEQGKAAPGWGTVRLLAKGLGVSMVELSAAVEGTRRPACATLGRSHFSRR